MKRIIVPVDVPSIQTAIDLLNPGGTIYIKEGTYTENITVSSKSIRLVGESRSGVVIQPSTNSPVLTFQNSSGCVVENLTVDGGGTSNGVSLAVSGDTNPNHDFAMRFVTLQNVVRGVELWNLSDRLLLHNVSISASQECFINTSGSTVSKIRIVLCNFVSGVAYDVISLPTAQYSLIHGNVLESGNYAVNESGGPNIISDNVSVGAAQASPFNVTGAGSLSIDNVVA